MPTQIGGQESPSIHLTQRNQFSEPVEKWRGDCVEGSQPLSPWPSCCASQPSAAGGAHILVSLVQAPPSLWLLLLFYMYLVFRPKETTSCFLNIPTLSWSMPCSRLFFLLKSYLSFQSHLQYQSLHPVFLNLPNQMSFLSLPTHVII